MPVHDPLSSVNHSLRVSPPGAKYKSVSKSVHKKLRMNSVMLLFYFIHLKGIFESPPNYSFVFKYYLDCMSELGRPKFGPYLVF